MSFSQSDLDEVQASGKPDDTAAAMSPTAAQTKRISDEALEAVKASSPPPKPEDPGFMMRAWHSITAPLTAPVAPTSGDLPPVLQAVMPPKQDRAAANAGFSEGFRRLWGTTTEAAAMDPTFSGMTPPNTDAYTDIRKQNVANAQAYNQRFGQDPDAQKGLMLANTAIGLPAAIAAPEAAALIARGAGAPVVGDFLAGTAGAQRGGFGGLVTRAGSRAVAGAEGGGAAGAVTADPSQPTGQQIMDSAINSGLLAPALGAPLDMASEAGRRLSGAYIGGRLPGGQLDPVIMERARQAQILQNNGVTVFGDQVGKDPLASFVRQSAGRLPGSGAKPYDALQQQQFRQGSTGIMGDQNAPPVATDAVMVDNRNRIGGYFNGVAARNNIAAGDLTPAFGQITSDLQYADPVTAQRAGLQMRNIITTMQRNGGQLPGADYLSLTRSGSTLQAMAAEGGVAGTTAQRILDSLHNGLAAGASPADQALLQTARDQTRAWHAINNARDSNGVFTPDSLYAAKEAQSDRFGGSRGIIDDHADAGKTILGTQSAAAAPSQSGLAASAALAAKFLSTVGGGAALTAAPLTLPINRGLQNLNRASGPRAIATTQAGGGAPVNPYLLALQRALPALMAQSRPQNGQQ
jgi:hypothetical protein